MIVMMMAITPSLKASSRPVGTRSLGSWCRYLMRRAGQLRDRPQRRLRGVQAEPEILVGVRREHVGRLVPVRIPAAADLRAALVLAQADRRDEVLERAGVGVRHVRADRAPDSRSRTSRSRPGRPTRASARSSAIFDVDLELDVDVGLGALLRAASCRRRAACRGRTSSCRAGSCRATSARDTCPSRPGSPCPAAPARCAT